MSTSFGAMAGAASWGRRAGLIAAVALAVTGCASVPQPAPETKLVWPEPPEQTRIEFVRSIVSKDDLKADATFTQKLSTFLGGEPIPEGRIAEPMGLAVSDDGERLYVSDLLQHVVFMFDFRNKVLRQTAVGAPSGIALDEEENLYVVDQARNAVSVFDRNGNFVRDIGDGSMVRPNGLALDRRNDRIYVVDTGNTESRQDVKIYNRSGQRIGSIGGKPGGDFSQFRFPTMAAVDGQGNLYVTDTINGRVQKFDAKGNFVTTFGQIGTAWGEFDTVKGIALDTFGNIYVVDTGWSNVQIFNPKGQVLMFFGGRGPLPGMMKNPISIAIDGRNRIYVGDYLNHRIGVYQLVNTTADDSFLSPPPNPAAQRQN